MANDTKHIEPALSAEEWATFERTKSRPLAGNFPQVHFRWAAEHYCPFGRYGAALATANAALPDRSEYKITREDIKTLFAFRMYVQDYADMTDGTGVAAGDVHKFDAFAAKLAALLPPA